MCNVVHGARLVEQFVEPGVAVLAVVLAAFAGHELMDITIRVRTARPGAHADLEVAARLFAEHRRVFSGNQVDLEARFFSHGLNDLPDLLRDRVVGHFQVHRQRQFHAGLRQQRFASLDIASRDWQVLVVIRAVFRERLSAWRVQALEHHLVNGVAVDGQLKRFAYALVLAHRRVGFFPVADVEHQLHVAQARCVVDRQLAVALDGFHIGWRNTLDDVQVAGAQVGQAHRGVRNRQEYDFVEVIRLFIPIVVEMLQHDSILLHALDKFVRAGADRVGGELALRSFWREHHPGAVRQLRNQRGVGLLELDGDGFCVDHLHTVHRGQLAFAQRVGEGAGAVEVELHRGSIKRFAIVVRHAFAQSHGQGFTVFAPVPGCGQLRRVGQIRIHVHQFVAQRGVHQSTGVGARTMRIQHIGIVLNADAQRRFGKGSVGGQQ